VPVQYKVQLALLVEGKKLADNTIAVSTRDPLWSYQDLSNFAWRQLRSEIGRSFNTVAYSLKKFQTEVRTSKGRDKVPFTLWEEDEFPAIEAEIERSFHRSQGKSEMVLFAAAHFELIVVPPPPSQPAQEQANIVRSRTGLPRRTATTLQEEELLLGKQLLRPVVLTLLPY